VHIRLANTFSALRVRNYRLFATGQLISLLGGWMQITAQDWLVLQLSGNSPSALGVVTALQFSPMLLLTLYGGKLADRFDKRRLLLIANSAYMTLATIMGVLVVSGAVQLWHVFLFAGLWGTVQPFEMPSRQSFVSEMVGRELLPNALALNSAVFNSARIIGPAIGGVVIYLVGTGPAFVVNAASYLGPLFALSRMVPAELHRDGVSMRSAAEARVRDGLRHVWGRPDLLVPMTLILITGLLAFNFGLTLPLMAKNVFHTNSASFGLLSTSLAIGALGGALAGSVRRVRPSVWLVLVAAIAFGGFETVTAFAPTLPAAIALLVPTGFTMIFFVQAANQRVQMGTSGEFRGRVMGLYTLVFMGTTPIGAPLVGWCATVFGPRSAIWIGGLGSVLAASVVLGLEMRRHGVRPKLRRNPVRVYLAPRPGYVPPAVDAEPVAQRV
jgi:MFS family permease